MRPQKWPDCDPDIKAFVLAFVGLVRETLAKNVWGIYLHGSLATGRYYRPNSDIDMIAVVRNKLDSAAARNLNYQIALFAETRPTVGSIEFSVITADTARDVPRPMPYELHYSSSWHNRILNDEVVYGQEQVDPDLQAHLFCLPRRGARLFGEPIADTFGEVRWEDFLEAVVDDFGWIVEGEHILESPYYGILNICRVFQALTENRHDPFSKDEGGQWGLAHFPPSYRPLIAKALHVYHAGDPVDEKCLKTGGAAWDRDQLLSFREYARTHLPCLPDGGVRLSGSAQ